MMGFMDLEFRLPLCKMQDNHREILREGLKAYKLI
jgi:hypothetical protein